MARQQPYADRSAAGRALGEDLARLLPDDPAGVVVLALPRGGVPVAVGVAERLGVPVSVLVVRKLGAPGQPELAVGAVAAVAGRVERVVNDDWVRRLGLTTAELDVITAAETAELLVRSARFGATPPVAGRTVVLVDDGLATGATMRVAVTAVRAAGARRVLVAAPVGSVGACTTLEPLVDGVVCPRRPEPFRAVGAHYRDFDQVDDAEVLRLLHRPVP